MSVNSSGVGFRDSLSSQDSLSIIVSYAGLILGYILISVGKNNWLRFSLHPRPDESLAVNLKSLDVRTTLFNYVPPFQADHLIATPSGLVVVETRPFLSDISVKGDKWSRTGLGFMQYFSEGPLGNPGREAQATVARVKSFLAERLGPDAEAVPVEPLVVLTHPRAHFTAEAPAVPVVYARDARPEVKRLTTGGKLPGDLSRRVDALLAETAKQYGEAVQAGEAIDKKARTRRRKPARAR